MKVKDYAEKHYKVLNSVKIIDHPARIQLLELLMKKGFCNSQDLATGFPIAFTSVSQHLKEFREFGLVQKKHSKSGIIYELNEEKFNAIKKAINDFLDIKKD